MCRNFSWAVIIVFFACSMIVAQVRQATPPQMIVGLERALKLALVGLDDITLNFTENGELVVEHQVQEFMVHEIKRDGQIVDKAHPERGPNVRGFRLCARVVASPRYQGPIVLSPQGYGSTSHPYWETEVREVRLPSADEYLWVTLAMGSRVDQKLLLKIHDSITKYVRQKSPAPLQDANPAS